MDLDEYKHLPNDITSQATAEATLLLVVRPCDDGFLNCVLTRGQCFSCAVGAIRHVMNRCVGRAFLQQVRSGGRCVGRATWRQVARVTNGSELRPCSTPVGSLLFSLPIVEVLFVLSPSFLPSSPSLTLP